MQLVTWMKLCSRIKSLTPNAKDFICQLWNLDQIELQKWNWSQGYEMDEIGDTHEPYDMHGFVCMNLPHDEISNEWKWKSSCQWKCNVWCKRSHGW
jgi:hypothetical protein